jgi:hypothetical protein
MVGFGEGGRRMLDRIQEIVREQTRPTDPTTVKLFPSAFEEPDCTTPRPRYSLSCSTTLTPKTITLRVVSKAEFNSAPLVSGEADSFKPVAFTYILHKPCEIVIPEGALINSEPETGKAEWDFGDASYHLRDTLAHEILHCYAGAWHDNWWKINWRRQRRNLLETKDFATKHFVSYYVKGRDRTFVPFKDEVLLSLELHRSNLYDF